MRVYVDMDGVLCDYTRSHNTALRVNPYIRWPQSQIDFFRKLDPLPGAVHYFDWISRRYDTYILTKPSVENPACYTEKRLWVEDHLGREACDRLMLVPNKNLLAGTGILIDDRRWSGFDELGHQILFDTHNVIEWQTIPIRLEKISKMINV